MDGDNLASAWWGLGRPRGQALLVILLIKERREHPAEMSSRSSAMTKRSGGDPEAPKPAPKDNNIIIN